MLVFVTDVEARSTSLVANYEESGGESSVTTEVVDAAKIEEVEDLLNIFDHLARIAEKRGVNISLNITFRKGKGSVDMNGKGKGKA